MSAPVAEPKPLEQAKTVTEEKFFLEGPHGTISRQDLDLFLFTDSVEEAVAHIEHHTIAPFGLKRGTIQPIKWLGEQKPVAG